MDTLAPIDFSLIEAENQRATKRPWILGFKVTHHVEAIKKIRQHELPCLEAMVMISFTSSPQATLTWSFPL